jgi:hypothetical protein
MGNTDFKSVSSEEAWVNSLRSSPPLHPSYFPGMMPALVGLFGPLLGGSNHADDEDRTGGGVRAEHERAGDGAAERTEGESASGEGWQGREGLPPYVPERREARLGVQARGALLRLGPHQLREVRLDNHEVPLVSRCRSSPHPDARSASKLRHPVGTLEFSCLLV